MDIRIREKASAFFKVTATTLIEKLEFVCPIIIKNVHFLKLCKNKFKTIPFNFFGSLLMSF